MVSTRRFFAWFVGFWKQEVIKDYLFHRPVWEAGGFSGVWESQINIYLYFSSAAMSEAACRLHHSKAGLPDTLGLPSGQDDGGLSICLFVSTLFLLQYLSVALQHVSHLKQNPLQDRWIFKIHNCLAVTVLTRLQFTYNSASGLAHCITSVFAKIQTQEQIEVLKKCSIC